MSKREDITNFRLDDEFKAKIDNVVENNKGIFPNRSVFIRSAINRLLKKLDQEGLKQ